MDNLQYYVPAVMKSYEEGSFKPYYKWITFNTLLDDVKYSPVFEF